MRDVSNAKAKRELNFQPRPLQWLTDIGSARAKNAAGARHDR
jgi:hypothetical protein